MVFRQHKAELQNPYDHHRKLNGDRPYLSFVASGDAGCLASGRRWAHPSEDRCALVCLNDVPFFYVLEILKGEAAFVPRGHFTHIILEASQAGQLTLVNNDLVP